MKTSLDCIPCFFQQALGAARRISPDPGIHRQVMREALEIAAGMTLEEPPELLVKAWLDGVLRSGENVCDH